MKNKSHSISSRKGWLSLLTCALLGSGSIHAQSITWAIVNAAGFENGDEGSLRWTIGEPLTIEVSGDEASLRVGFIPFALVEEITSTSKALDPDIKITISPNPAADEMHVNVPGHESCMIRILSLDGRSKMAADIMHDATLNIGSLPAGPYVLYVIKPNGTFNSTKFIKS